MNKTEELAFCGPLKTAMMLLIVLYHSCAAWMGGWWAEPVAVESVAVGVFASWLNTFHVPVFVFVSGYLYAYLKRETDRYGNMRVVLSKKVRRLLVPYAFVSAVWAAPFFVAFYGAGPAEIFRKYVAGGGASQLWFLLMLFDLFVLFELLHRFAPRIVNSPRVLVAACAGLYVLGVVIGHVLPFNVLQVASACCYAVVFALGYVARGADTARFWKVPWPAFAAADLAMFALYWLLGGMDGFVFSAICVLLLPCLRVAGIVMAASALGRVAGVLGRLDSSVFGRHSFTVYLFHQQLVWVALCFVNVSFVPPVLVAAICFAFSLAGSMGISAVLSRFNATRFLTGQSPLPCGAHEARASKR